jgi:hypothetical protein
MIQDYGFCLKQSSYLSYKYNLNLLRLEGLVASAVQNIIFCVIGMETASGKQEITFIKMSFAYALRPRCIKGSIRIVISNCPNECNAVCVCFVVS